MRRTTAFVLAAVFVLTAATLGGCSTLFKDWTAEANTAIADANTHLTAYQASDKKVQEFAAQLNTLDATPAGAAQALEITGKIKTELATEKTELQESAKAIAKIKTLEVNDTFKNYADLEVAALTARIAVVDEGIKLYTEMDRLYTAIRDKKATGVLTTEITANIDTIYAKVQELSDAAKKATDAAEAYFEKVGS
jgi:hypothetical protein